MNKNNWFAFVQHSWEERSVTQSKKNENQSQKKKKCERFITDKLCESSWTERRDTDYLIMFGSFSRSLI